MDVRYSPALWEGFTEILFSIWDHWDCNSIVLEGGNFPTVLVYISVDMIIDRSRTGLYVQCIGQSNLVLCHLVNEIPVWYEICVFSLPQFLFLFDYLSLFPLLSPLRLPRFTPLYLFPAIPVSSPFSFFSSLFSLFYPPLSFYLPLFLLSISFLPLPVRPSHDFRQFKPATRRQHWLPRAGSQQHEPRTRNKVFARAIVLSLFIVGPVTTSRVTWEEALKGAVMSDFIVYEHYLTAAAERCCFYYLCPYSRAGQ